MDRPPKRPPTEPTRRQCDVTPARGLPDRVRARFFRDALRLVHLVDVLSRLGDLLLRRSLRYTLLMVAIALLGYGSKAFGLSGFTARQAFTLPLLVGGTTLVGGLLLKFIPAMLASRRLVIAQAAEINLMEDYRKAQAPEHLEALWDRVFCAEVDVDPGAPKTREAFLATAQEVLATPHPQTRERYEMGVDLHLLEDWYDGAYLDRSDVKLGEQFDGDPSIRYAARLIHYGALADLPALPGRWVQHLWFLLCTRSVAIHVADAVDSLNQRFDTSDFNAQVILWPGEEDAPWLARYPGARQEVLSRRGALVRQTFGRTPARTRVMVARLFGMEVRRATRLRLLMDPEYAAGALGTDPLEDLRAWGVPAADPIARLARQRRAWLAAALPALEDAIDDALGRGDDRPATLRRAALVLCHARAGSATTRPEAANDGWARLAEDAIEQARPAHERISQALLQVRIHQTLAGLAVHGYTRLIDTLRTSSDAP